MARRTRSLSAHPASATRSAQGASASTSASRGPTRGRRVAGTTTPSSTTATAPSAATTTPTVRCRRPEGDAARAGCASARSEPRRLCRVASPLSRSEAVPDVRPRTSDSGRATDRSSSPRTRLPHLARARGPRKGARNPDLSARHGGASQAERHSGAMEGGQAADRRQNAVYARPRNGRRGHDDVERRRSDAPGRTNDVGERQAVSPWRHFAARARPLGIDGSRGILDPWRGSCRHATAGAPDETCAALVRQVALAPPSIEARQREREARPIRPAEQCSKGCRCSCRWS